MCETLKIKRIPVKSFRFKRDDHGWTARYGQYSVHVEGTGKYWWWDVYEGSNEIAESDFAYKTDAATYSIAKKRAIKTLNKWRIDHE